MPKELEIIEVSSVEEAEEMAKFFRTIWTGEDDVVPFDLALAAIHVGAYAAIAKSDGQVVAGSFGILGNFASHTVLHSHVTGSTLAGAGHQLKLHQYEWAKQRGIGGITWTFDPLVRRNCVFNFEKLGAFAVEYLPNFYGTMTDDINRGDESDRLFTYWPVADVVESPNTKSSQFAIKNMDGKPAVQSVDTDEAFWVALPEDIEALRKTDLGLVAEWRQAVRSVLEPALEAGSFIRQVNADRTAILVEPSTSEYEFKENE